MEKDVQTWANWLPGFMVYGTVPADMSGSGVQDSVQFTE